MTIVKGDVLAFLEAGLKKAFYDVYLDTKPGDDDWKRIIMEMPSDGDSEKYALLGANPAMREFKDERKPSGFQSNNFEIVNKKFESTVKVDRDIISDDRYGQIVKKIRIMGEVARKYYGERAWEVFFEGDTATYGTCYDGKTFFANDHAEGNVYTSAQDNLLGLALTADNLSTARLTMRNFRDDRGKKLNIVGKLLVVPPELEETAFKIVNSPTVDASGNVNYHKGQYEVVVRPEIEDTDSWALVSPGAELAPLIFQNREPTEFVALEGQSQDGFLKEVYYYGVRNRFEIGYGDWRRAIMSVP